MKQQQSLSETKLSAAAALHLPDDCWESICTFLIDGDNNHRYLEPLSLASKHFLSITNRLRSSFTIFDETFPFIQTLFHRFPNLTSLHITSYFQTDNFNNDLLCHISEFPFNLKSLKFSNQICFPTKGLLALSKKITTLTSLTCTGIASFSDDDFVLISNCFPSLQELHLRHNRFCSQSVRIGVEAMLIALPKLRKINLSGGFCNINDDSLLLHLCKNCEFLEEVVMCSFVFLTYDGIASAIRQRPTLRSLSFVCSSCKIDDNIISSHFIDSLVSLKGLTCLDLSWKNISDELLSSIAMGDLPLRRLVLLCCTGYSYAGVFSLLSKCQRIQHLDLYNAEFLNDHHIVTLSSFLADLVSINLGQCWQLTDSALFALVRNCPSLNNIKMEKTRMGEKVAPNSNFPMNFVLNPELKYLYLARNSLLKDESLLMFASILTNLQLLDLSYCNYISEEGICQVLRRCCKIRHLNLAGCNVAKLHILNFEVPKLEVLDLSYTNVDDETLYAISKNCGLLQLLLIGCHNVTKKGVKHVVENCMQLREINLACCTNVCPDIVDNMVHSRPSLRKIISPFDYHLSDEKRELFWHRGCHVF